MNCESWLVAISSTSVAEKIGEEKNVHERKVNVIFWQRTCVSFTTTVRMSKKSG